MMRTTIIMFVVCFSSAAGASLDGRCMKIEKDFNGDSYLDLALSHTSSCGNGGCWWFIHMKRPDNSFSKPPINFFFHSKAINFRGDGENSLVTTYGRSSGSEGYLIEHLLTSTGIKEISRKTIQPGDAGVEEDRLLYDSLFGGLRKNPISKYISNEECNKLHEEVKS